MRCFNVTQNQNNNQFTCVCSKRFQNVTRKKSEKKITIELIECSQYPRSKFYFFFNHSPLLLSKLCNHSVRRKSEVFIDLVSSFRKNSEKCRSFSLYTIYVLSVFVICFVRCRAWCHTARKKI